MGTNITNGTQWTFLDMNLTDLCNATNVTTATNATNITNAHCNATNATDVSFRDRCNPPGGSSGGVDVQALIGIFLAALSALISSVALVIMKRSADVEVGLPLCKRWRWWLGFVINTGSELTLSTVALTLAPLAIIAPVFGTQVIFSAMIARAGCVPGVKEMMSLCEWICLAGAIAGIALCSAFGPSSETAILYEEYQIYLPQGRYLGFLVPSVTLVFCWSLVLTNKRLTWLRPKDDSLTTAVFSSLGAGIAGSCSIVSSRIFTTALIWELIVDGNTKVLGMWVSWLGVFGLIASAPTQLWLLNSALASGKAAFTVPLYTVMITVFNIVQGGTLFDEFACLAGQPVQTGVFSAALALVLGSVAVLSMQQEAKKTKSAAVGSNAAPSSLPSAGPLAGIAIVVVEDDPDAFTAETSTAPARRHKSSLEKVGSFFGMSPLGKMPAKLARATTRRFTTSPAPSPTAPTHAVAAPAPVYYAHAVVKDAPPSTKPKLKVKADVISAGLVTSSAD